MGQKGIQEFKQNREGRYVGGILIPSGQFAFLITEELVKIPANAMGFTSLKTKSAKFKGLVNISGFHVDPGYEGRLIFSVFNAGPSPIHIKAGDPLFLLWMADIDVSNNRPADSARIKRDKPVTSIASDIISNVSDKLVSLQDMSKKIDDLQDQLFRIYAVVGALVAVIVFIGVVAALFGATLTFS